MSELEVSRWRKHGKDRLYVRRGDGDKVGWVDLRTGQQQLESPHDGQAFLEAITAYCERHGVELPASTASAGAARVAGPAERQAPPPWTDLSSNVPGQSARARANDELAAARSRSRVGSAVARLLDVKTDERAWRVGAGGEEAVGARLNKLKTHGWHVLHAVPVGTRGSDIDHVVIGPAGVWTINTKRHPDKSVVVTRDCVRVEGRRQRYLEVSRYEAERAGHLLTKACGFPVEVKAALVFLTGTLFPDVTVKQAPDGVAILDRTDIPGALRRAKRRLDDAAVAAIFEQARRSTTWQQEGRSRVS